MLSPYLHFGCVSARELEEKAGRHDAYTRQLAWRDFYAHVLLHHPDNARHAYRRELDAIEWDGRDEHFDAWREGRTGYPIVDAGMRELAATGWMHNRARLITACFLVKDLHIDWRRGEQHFMRLLLDGDEANNNGNWQWISSVGVDPAPVSRRLYNPVLQQQRHDPGGRVRPPVGPGARGRAARAARDAVGGRARGPDRRPRRRAPPHARGIRRRPLLSSRAMDQLYVQRDQPPGVPPLHLTGERTLPDVPEENYWYRRHLVVYEWIAQRVARAHGRRPRVRRGLRLRGAGADRARRWSASTPTPRPSSTPAPKYRRGHASSAT